MSNPGKGGRGKRAPYETQHYRIPVPIKLVVEMLSNAYKQAVGGVTDPTGSNLIKRVEDAIAANADSPSKPGTSLTQNDKPGTILTDTEDFGNDDNNGFNDGDDDFDDDDDDFYNDNTEPTNEEIIRQQAKNNQFLISEVKALEREGRALERELETCRQEIDKLKAEREKALSVLALALKLESNSGGAIKDKIQEAFLPALGTPGERRAGKKKPTT